MALLVFLVANLALFVTGARNWTAGGLRGATACLLLICGAIGAGETAHLLGLGSKLL
jgi:hypothetical protein